MKFYDLIYCEDNKDYMEIKELLQKRFPSCMIDDASDDIHHYRFSIQNEKDIKKDFIKFAIRKGFALCSIYIQMASYDTPASKEDHEELKKILEELKKEKEDKMNNRNFAKEDNIFISCCKLANILPTKRQAGKFKRGEGLAYKYLEQVTNPKDNKIKEKK